MQSPISIPVTQYTPNLVYHSPNPLLFYFLDLGQAGETVTIAGLTPDNYLIRVTATAGRERDDITSNVAITSPGTCTTNFVGRGLTIDGESVVIEFASSGFGQRSFTCSLDRGLPQACKPYNSYCSMCLFIVK